MKVEHHLQIVASCPVDDCPDLYRVVIRTARLILVEDIRKAIKEAAQEKMCQEQLCEVLHRKLACEVEVTGWHSGVFTRVTCGGEG